MSTDRRARLQTPLALGVALAILALLVATGLLLQEYGPGTWAWGSWSARRDRSSSPV